MFFLSNSNADQNQLLAAKTFLEHAAASNLPEFLKALSDILANESCSSVARTAAGLQLKNHLTSKDDLVQRDYRNRWLSFPEAIREYVKKNVSTIGEFRRVTRRLTPHLFTSRLRMRWGQRHHVPRQPPSALQRSLSPSSPSSSGTQSSRC